MTFLFSFTQAIEKFSANTTQIGTTIHKLCRLLQEAEFPNDVLSTETLIQSTDVSKVGSHVCG